MLLSCRPLRIIGFAAKGSGKPKVVCIDVRESPTEAIGQKWRLRRYLDAQGKMAMVRFGGAAGIIDAAGTPVVE